MSRFFCRESLCKAYTVSMAHLNDTRTFPLSSKRELLEEILKNNPFYKFKWKTADDYIEKTNCLKFDDMTWMEAENILISELEDSMAYWPFSDAEYYNPYWEMNKEEYNALSKEIEKLYVTNRIF